jgi:hypothetical protein
MEHEGGICRTEHLQMGSELAGCEVSAFHGTDECTP